MRFRRVLFACFLFAMALGCIVTPEPAQAVARAKTRIVFDVASGTNYGRYWSLDATSVAPVSAKGRLLYYRKSTRAWVPAARRTVSIVRGTADSGYPYTKWSVRTDSKGYFRVTMSVPDRYAMRYSGSSTLAATSATKYRIDKVEMNRTTSIVESIVDESSSRLTVVTDYRYNPRVAQLSNHVGLWSALGAIDSDGEVGIVYSGEHELLRRPFTGSARCEYSVIVPADVFKGKERLFVSDVEYPGPYVYTSAGPDDAPTWDLVGPRVPQDLWKPEASAIPTSGTYVYLASDPGDYVGAGGTYLYTSPESEIGVRSYGTRAVVSVDNPGWWDGNFQMPAGHTRLKPGYYAGLTRWPFHDPVVGGLDWSGNGRGANRQSGWFAIDKATYVGDVLTELDLRFEQHAESRTPALRGSVHWVTTNPPLPPGPILPVPSQLWQAPTASMPDTSVCVLLDSDEGDYIGQGQTYVYTAEDEIAVSQSGKTLHVNVDGWHGEFVLPSAESSFRPGYYGYLKRAPFCDPAQGGLQWAGHGRGSNTLHGWYVIDEVSYTEGVLTSVDLRFEQHNEGRTPALNGRVRWRAEP